MKCEEKSRGRLLQAFPALVFQRALRRAHGRVLHRLRGGGLRLPAQEEHHVQRPEAREPDAGRQGLRQTGDPRIFGRASQRCASAWGPH